MEHLPINEQILAEACCLSPSELLKKYALEHFRRLTSALIDVVRVTKVISTIGFRNNSTKFEVIYDTNRQFLEYQTKAIPDECKESQPKVQSRQNQQSYSREAYSQL